MLFSKHFICILLLLVGVPLQLMSQFDNLQFYQEKERWGLQNKDGQIIIPLKYEKPLQAVF